MLSESPTPQSSDPKWEFPKTRGHLRVPLKVYDKGTIRVPLKDSIRVWSFRKLGVPYFGILVIRILLFRVLYSGPLLSETPKYHPVKALGCRLEEKFRVRAQG